MDVYLVKEHVKVIKVTEAFSKTKRFNEYIERLGNKAKDAYGTTKSEDLNGLCTVLTVPNLPVTLRSVGRDVTAWQSERFAERVDFILKTQTDDWYGNIKLELILCNAQGSSLAAYFLISSQSIIPKKSKINLFTRLGERFDLCDIRFRVKVSLGYLPTCDAPASQDTFVFNLTGSVGSGIPIETPPEMKKWWEQETGFIHSKSSVKIRLSGKAVDFIYVCNNGGYLVCRGPPNLEIVCKKKGEIVECYRESLAAKSEVLRAKFAELQMLKLETANVGRNPRALKMEMDLGREGAKAFLEYSYGSGLSKSLWRCELALDMYKAGREYGIWKLEEAMVEIILGKGSWDLEYFDVESVLEMFLYAKKNGLKQLGEKAVIVLRNYAKTPCWKLEGRKEYQILLQNEPGVAMELSQLCI